MDKKEYQEKLDEIGRLVAIEDYGSAAQVADSIDWKRVRNVQTLLMVSEIYEAVNRYEDSKTLLLRAYRRSPLGRTVLYRLVECTIALKQFDEAIEYYSEYCQAAPRDNNRYILKYKIYRARGSSVEEQIDILKEYLSYEKDSEKWSYELAKLYREAGRMQECINTCDDLVLWFQSGRYVTKALELKRKIAPLTPRQQEIYDHRFDDAQDESDQDEEGPSYLRQARAEQVSLQQDAIKSELAEDISKAARNREKREAEEAARFREEASVQNGQEESEEAGRQAVRVSQDPPHLSPDMEMNPQEESRQEEAAESSAEGDEGTSPQGSGKDAGAVNPESVPDAHRYDTKTMQQNLVESMHRIVAGVGLKNDIDEEQQRLDRVIDQSKEDQEQAVASRGVGMTLGLSGAGTVKKAEAPKLTIDDILLSMGEKGRKAAAEAKAPSGVISAEEEARAGEAAAAAAEGSVLQPDVPAAGVKAEDQAGQETAESAVQEAIRQEREAAVKIGAAAKQPEAEEAAAAEAGEAPSAEAGAEPEEVPAAETSAEPEEIPAAETSAEPEEVPAAEAVSETAGTEAEPEEIPAAETSAEPEETPAAEAVSETAGTETEPEEAPPAEVLSAEPEETPSAEPASGAAGAEAEPEKTEDAQSGVPSDLQASGLYSELTQGFSQGVTSGGQKSGMMQEGAAAETQSSLPPAGKTEYTKEIAEAKTRVLPTEEISKLHQRYLEQEKQARQSVSGQAPAQESAPAGGKLQEMSRTPAQESAPAAGKEQDGGQKARQEASSGEQVMRQVQPQEDQAEVQYARMARQTFLKDYQRDLFRGFLGIGNLEEQIAKAISQAQMRGDDRTSRSGNILILGGHGCGKTTIATGIAKAIAEDMGTHSVKMARIYAADLNRKDIAATIAKIAGGVLIIEEAGDLDDGIVDQLTTAMEFRTDGLLVILEDEQRYIHDLLMRHPRFTMKFTSQIYIPPYSSEDLVRFGELYAESQDCTFSDKARDALLRRLDNVAERGEAVSITNVVELVDNAIRSADKFFRRIQSSKKRYDSQNRVILLEKDFR